MRRLHISLSLNRRNLCGNVRCRCPLEEPDDIAVTWAGGECRVHLCCFCVERLAQLDGRRFDLIVDEECDGAD